MTYVEAYNEIFHQKLESIEWKKQGPDLRYAASHSVFKKNFLRFINSSPNKVFFLLQLQRNQISHKTMLWFKLFERAQIQTEFSRYPESILFVWP